MRAPPEKEFAMKITITEPCKISGQDYDPGDTVDLDDADALSVVGANRGTIDPVRAAAVVDKVEADKVAAEKSKAKL